MSRRQVSSPNVFARLWSKAFAAGRRKAALSRRPRVRPQLEYLEDRLVPAVINVTTLADGAGAGTLRSAIAQANTNDANGDTNNTINLTVAGNYNVGQLGLGGLQIFANATANQSGLSLTIQNTSGGNVAISGDNMTRVFDINPNVVVPANNVVLGAVTINGVTIENGLASDVNNAGRSQRQRRRHPRSGSGRPDPQQRHFDQQLGHGRRRRRVDGERRQHQVDADAQQHHRHQQSRRRRRRRHR